jgi:1-deoxy-D-xylulose 5-phosphate reductoisomerase
MKTAEQLRQSLAIAENTVDTIVEAMDHVQRITAITKTVWLALMAAPFDENDRPDVADTLYEALKKLGTLNAALKAANEADIKAFSKGATP